MSNPNGAEARSVLQQIAHRVMLERGLEPEFPPAAFAELAAIHGPAPASGAGVRDMRHLLWCSIDNDDSRDLDQLSVAEPLPDGTTRLLVAVADVTATVVRQTALDDHAQHNTTSVYTAAQIFPMLPEKLSTDLTSLNFGVDRRAMVIDMVVSTDGLVRGSEIYPAAVHNQAKLAYPSVAAWLEGTGPMPAALAAVDGLAENVRLQDRIAGQLRERRHTRGALPLETVKARPIFDGAMLKDLTAEKTNRAQHLIEDLMIAANGVTAVYLASQRVPSLRRVVRSPKHWDRLIELAAAHGAHLSPQPDARALFEFLEAARAADPIRFPDLSLSVIKLLGAGEYVVDAPGAEAPGHFGLAVRDYAHSTAPNRRFPDIITQRLLKAALTGTAAPYPRDELEQLAVHCTEQEDEAKKVERQVDKSAAALLLRNRIGQEFDGLVTGAADKGTWVRLFHPPVEGRVVRGFERRKVGERVRARLVHTDVERGYLDFALV
jgi:VacB/RNase II family 3'-5' exoribonuclease